MWRTRRASELGYQLIAVKTPSLTSRNACSNENGENVSKPSIPPS